MERVRTTVIVDMVTCSVCFEEMKDPRSLRCLHTFCTSCLEKVVHRQLHQISCPLCKTVTVVEKGGVRTLPADFKVDQMRDILQGLQVTSSSPREISEKSREKPAAKTCDVCSADKARPAVFHCIQCAVFYCEECAAKHNSNRLFTKHNVRSISNEMLNTSLLCTKHRDQIVRYVCRTCEPSTCLCVICTFHHDKSHNVVDCSKAAQDYRNDLQAVLHQVQDKHRQLLERDEEVKRRIADYEDMLRVEQERISEHAANVVDQVRHTEMELLKEVQEKVEETVSRLGLRSDVLQQAIGLQQSLQAVIDGSDQAVLAEFSTLSQLAQMIKAENVAELPNPVVQFIPTEDVSVVLGHVLESERTGRDTARTERPLPVSPSLPTTPPIPPPLPPRNLLRQNREVAPRSRISRCDGCHGETSRLTNYYCTQLSALEKLCASCSRMHDLRGHQFPDSQPKQDQTASPRQTDVQDETGQ